MKHERGQTLIVVAVIFVVLVIASAFYVDIQHILADRQKAQDAANAAATAAAGIGIREDENTRLQDELKAKTAAIRAAIEMRITPSDEGARLELQVVGLPPGATCPGKANGRDYFITIQTFPDTTFLKLFGIVNIKNTVRAVARRCNSYVEPFFRGNTVVGLNPNISFNAFGDAGWIITGGGLYANGHVEFSPKAGARSKIPGISSAGNVTNAPTGVKTSKVAPFDYKNIQEIMPADPCIKGGVGLADPYEGKDTIPARMVFENGVYCINDFDKFDHRVIMLQNATLYIKDQLFSLTFPAGGFSGAPTEKGRYMGYYLIAHVYPDTTCAERNGKPALVFAGNGLDHLSGTVLAPSACIDVRGNFNTFTMNSQVIGQTIFSGGADDFTIGYDKEKNAKRIVPAAITLIEDYAAR